MRGFPGCRFGFMMRICQALDERFPLACPIIAVIFALFFATVFFIFLFAATH